ncbi:MAG: hypothetical protein K5668_01715 [Lachnospiraceae bacterium]|nr:hypothetical protein [Lachnospiraceae bacterium]
MQEASQENNSIKPAIVVVAYDRARALERLLGSIGDADYSGLSDVTLIISLDKSGNTEVENAVDSFAWKYGEKKVIKRSERMGLKKHILSCGDLCREYGSIIMLEDDLFVSPLFYHYTCAALEKVGNEDRVAGVSLYSHRFNVFARLPFDAVDDGYDNFYFRFPCSWGQAWTLNEWVSFREWLDAHDGEDLKGNGMPEPAAEWGSSSWLKYALKYVIEEDKTWFYPRISYTTNFFDEGEHSKEAVTDLQVPLSLGRKRDFCFSLPDQSGARYDPYFENEGLPFQADIYGLKRRDNALKEGPFYSSEILPFGIRESFGLSLRPADSNILFRIPGEGISLYDPAVKRNVRQKGSARLEKYFYPGMNRKKIMKLIGDRFLERYTK